MLLGRLSGWLLPPGPAATSVGVMEIPFSPTTTTCTDPSSMSSPSPLQVPVPAERRAAPQEGTQAIAEVQLLTFENPSPARVYEVSIELPEFTCLCPFSGYPDFAILRLLYQPGPRVLELKALKLYVNSFRNRSISHEAVSVGILDDLVAAADPIWIELIADFNRRGNVHTVVRVSHGERQPC